MAESDSIEYSLGKYRMINGEIYRQKATAAIKSVCMSTEIDNVSKIIKH